jgi:hypothetical protein
MDGVGKRGGRLGWVSRPPLSPNLCGGELGQWRNLGLADVTATKNDMLNMFGTELKNRSGRLRKQPAATSHPPGEWGAWSDERTKTWGSDFRSPEKRSGRLSPVQSVARCSHPRWASDMGATGERRATRLKARSPPRAQRPAVQKSATAGRHFPRTSFGGHAWAMKGSRKAKRLPLR